MAFCFVVVYADHMVKVKGIYDGESVRLPAGVKLSRNAAVEVLIPTQEESGDQEQAYWRILLDSGLIIEVTEPLIEKAMELSERHGLRGYDSVQLAAALCLQAVRTLLALPPLLFVSADTPLNASAAAEGLVVDDPNSHEE